MLLKTELQTASTGTALELEEIKRHLRIPLGYTHDDDYVEVLRDVTQEWVENHTNQKLVTQRWKLWLDGWPSTDYCITMPYAPLASVPSTGIVYKDSEGDSTTFSSSAWESDIISIPGRICLGYDESWPTDTLWSVNPISVEFVCGYGNYSTSVPVKIRQAMLLLIGDMYENRENTLVGVVPHSLKTAERLLASERVFKF